jgi:hypothetical protein
MLSSVKRRPYFYMVFRGCLCIYKRFGKRGRSNMLFIFWFYNCNNGMPR